MDAGPSWEPKDGKSTRPGFVSVPTLVAEKPESILKFDFQGTGVGIFVASGPDTGDVEYRVDGGAWRTQPLFTRWSHHLHLPWAKMLATELSAGPHQLELKTTSNADKSSTGNAVRIVYLLVN